MTFPSLVKCELGFAVRSLQFRLRGVGGGHFNCIGCNEVLDNSTAVRNRFDGFSTGNDSAFIQPLARLYDR